MILKDKTILIMGLRNKWSIAWGAAMSAHKQGAKLLFTYNGKENEEKINELISEIPGSKAYECEVIDDSKIQETLQRIKENHKKIDGILHSIAHANTEDLRNDFINTSQEGFLHAHDISAYSLVAVSRIARDLNLLTKNASIVTLTYHGSTKVLENYNIMGVAKASLECSTRYLAGDLGKIGIRINAVSAGPIKTLSAKGIKDFNKILEVVEEKAPLKRNVTAEEVGDTISFLLSPMASSVTGQVLYADNGYCIMGI